MSILDNLPMNEEGYLGSGSKCMIMSNCKVVFDNKPACHEMMHIFGFRE